MAGKGETGNDEPLEPAEYVRGVLREEGMVLFTRRELELFSRMEACLNCGLCLSHCPVLEVTSHSRFGGPRAIANRLSRSVPDFWAAADLIYLCTGCGVCQEICPHSVPVPAIVNMVRHKILEQRPDLVPKAIRELLDTAQSHGLALEPRDPAQKERSRAGRLRLLHLPQIPDRIKDKAEVLYFPGCQAEERILEVREAVKLVLERMGVDYSLPREPVCCGLPLDLGGNPKLAEELAKKVLDQAQQLGARILLTSCAGCTSTLKEQAKMMESSVEVKHLVEFIAEDYGLDRFASILPREAPPLRVAIHHPCHLARHVGWHTVELTRIIVSQLPHVTLTSLGEEGTRCCGGGGLVPLHTPAIPHRLSRRKAPRITEAKPQILVTPCPVCTAQLADGLFRAGSSLPVRDLAVLLAQRLHP